MTNDKGPATAGAPTPETVDKAISRLHGRADCSSIFGDVKKSMGENEELVGTIRAHIAALEHKHADLVTRCVQAESDRDALVAENKRLVDAIKGVIRVADRKTVEFDEAKAAIAQTGEKW